MTDKDKHANEDSDSSDDEDFVPGKFCVILLIPTSKKSK